MVLIEEYYELHEAENVTTFWKSLHITFYICAAGFGIWCGFTVAILRKVFDNRCFLFAKVSWDHLKDTGEIEFVSPEQENDESFWSQHVICDFCQYTMVSSFIFSTIWGAFFLMCGNGGKSITGLPQPWRIVLPAMIFNFIYFILSFSAALGIHNGLNRLCKEPVHSVEFETFEKCTMLQIYKRKLSQNTVLLLEIVNKTSWITAGSWFIAFLITFMRIIFVTDFITYKISVYKIDNLRDQNEELIQVVEYEGKHVHFGSNNDQGKRSHED